MTYKQKKTSDKIKNSKLKTRQKKTSKTQKKRVASKRSGNSSIRRESYPKFSSSEIVIGLVGAVGTNLEKVSNMLLERLRVHGYRVEAVSISKDIILEYSKYNKSLPKKEFKRVSFLMDKGNEARKQSGDNSILALGAAAWISSKRSFNAEEKPEHMSRTAFVIRSLKHPAEVEKLREIYPRGFYLLGVFASEDERVKYLVDDKRMSKKQAKQLIERDQDEQLTFGQNVKDTFHMSDVFVRYDEEERLKQDIWRFLEIIFANPYQTPTIDEFAMFLAFSSSLRSSELGRQVGAVIVKDDEIVATGANECPKAGGGQYWPMIDETEKKIVDIQGGREYTRVRDSNVTEQEKIINDILEKGKNKGINENLLKEILDESRIRDLTEFGRAVHAEMEALLCCARNNVSTREATLYCTTFPCHNCAKHIVAAGIKRVIYVEPYAKSKAAQLHNDAIRIGFVKDEKTVHFEPFVGIGPRRFFDLFSMKLGSGLPVNRKDEGGYTYNWKPEKSSLRLQMLPNSYLESELNASTIFKLAKDNRGNKNEPTKKR